MTLQEAIKQGQTANDPCRKGGQVESLPEDNHEDCRILDGKYSAGETRHWTDDIQHTRMKIRSHVPRSHVPNRTKLDGKRPVPYAERQTIGKHVVR